MRRDYDIAHREPNEDTSFLFSLTGTGCLPVGVLRALWLLPPLPFHPRAALTLFANYQSRATDFLPGKRYRVMQSAHAIFWLKGLSASSAATTRPSLMN